MSKQRALLTGLTMMVLTLVLTAPANAGRRWCEADPVFLIAGREVNVVTAIEEENVPTVTGPVAVTLYVPTGVSALLVSTDAGYNGYGEVVSIVPVSWLAVTKRGVEVLVEVTIPANRTDVPVNVFVTPAGGWTVMEDGDANEVIPVRFFVSPAS
jgi:hypothetical protein